MNLQNKHKKLKAVYILLSILLIAFLSSCFLLVKYKWQFPLNELLQTAPEENPKILIAQLLVLAQTGVSLLTGGLLAVVSLLLQQVVRNNLASESTLAIGSGAQLMMLAVIVFFPNFALIGNFWIAFLGAMISVALVVVIALPSKLSPIIMILAGVVINILCTALISLVMVFYSNYLNSLLLWAMGYLYQDNWATLQALSIVSICSFFAVYLLKKPLTVMLLDDQQAKQLGVPIHYVRTLVFISCAVVTAFIVSRVGLISFIGLGAATIVNVMRISGILPRLLAGFIIGAMLLALANNLVVILEHFIQLPKPIPVGILTGLLGAPIILWLIIKQRKKQITESISQMQVQAKVINWSQYWLSTFTVVIVAILFVNSNDGWYFDFASLTTILDKSSILTYRFVRTLTAATTGIMLAISGLLLQRITQNPMASPEVLGVSSASAIAMVFAFLFVANISPLGIFAFGVLGSCLVMILLLWLMRFVSTSYLLLIGIAIGAIMNSLMMVVAFIDDPRLQLVLGWLSGSTYHAQPVVAAVLLIIAIIAITVSLLLSKQINILSLNDSVARSLGMSVNFMQTILLILIAIMSTFATMAIGPLSFIGLMIPHLAKSLGAVEIKNQLLLSAMLGALFMMIADWLGRYLTFPFEIAAGTLVSVFGCSYFLSLIRKIDGHK